MASAPESTAATEQVVFEPDDVTFADGRVTVTGRWFGVRGRRFVRPSLSLGRDGGASRVLADLEHKPWSAEDGEPWTAAFDMPRGSGGAEELELAVAPDIAVVFDAPDALRARPKRTKPARGGAHRAPARGDGGSPQTRPASRNGDGSRLGGTAMAASQAKVEEQQAEIARLRDQLRRNEVAKAELKAAESRRDAAVAKLDAVLEERDAAIAERDAAVAARNAAVVERDAAAAERDAAVAERDAAVAERDAARVERGAFSEEYRRLTQERDALSAERDALRRRHREHERIQTSLGAERDLLRAQLEQARAAAQAAAAAAAVPPPAAAAPAPAPAISAPALAATSAPARVPGLRADPPRRIAALQISDPFGRQTLPAPGAAERSPTAIWVTRAIALGVLLIAIAALLLIVESV